jgi:hypothetical protein
MPQKGSEIVDIEVTLVHDTGKAWKVTSHTTGKTVWIAYQMGELDTDSNPATLTLPTYIAEEKELV